MRDMCNDAVSIAFPVMLSNSGPKQGIMLLSLFCDPNISTALVYGSGQSTDLEV